MRISDSRPTVKSVQSTSLTIVHDINFLSKLPWSSKPSSKKKIECLAIDDSIASCLNLNTRELWRLKGTVSGDFYINIFHWKTHLSNFCLATMLAKIDNSIFKSWFCSEFLLTYRVNFLHPYWCPYFGKLI